MNDIDRSRLVLRAMREEQDKIKAAYIKGWERAVWLYAVNKDGEQLVGVMGKPINSVLKQGPDTNFMSADLEQI